MLKALILGVTGQDGQYLADFLLRKKYSVLGISRSRRPFQTNPLSLNRPDFKSIDIRNTLELEHILNEFQPHEIYNLAGESSVSKSFHEPSKTIESNVVGFVNLLTLVKQSLKLKNVRIFQASSAEMFGSSMSQLNEASPFNPVSPYSASKLAAHKISDLYRQNYGIWVSCGILFNHESELRPRNFVFQKIITSAIAISEGKLDKLTLGNIDVLRDWGYSKDYVEAIWMILQADSPDNFVVATGKVHSLQEIIRLAFSTLKIDSLVEDLVKFDSSLSRPNEVLKTWGDPTKIENALGWRAQTSFEDLVQKLITFQLNLKS